MFKLNQWAQREIQQHKKWIKQGCRHIPLSFFENKNPWSNKTNMNEEKYMDEDEYRMMCRRLNESNQLDLLVIQPYSDLLHYALESGDNDLVEFVAQYADEVVFMHAVKRNYDDVVRYLLPNVPQSFLSAALRQASLNNYSDIVFLLLENDVGNQYNSLIYAVRAGHTNLVRDLLHRLEWDDDELEEIVLEEIIIPDRYDMLPIFLSRNLNNTESLELLYEMALEWNRPEIASFINSILHPYDILPQKGNNGFKP